MLAGAMALSACGKKDPGPDPEALEEAALLEKARQAARPSEPRPSGPPKTFQSVEAQLNQLMKEREPGQRETRKPTPEDVALEAVATAAEQATTAAQRDAARAAAEAAAMFQQAQSALQGRESETINADAAATTAEASRDFQRAEDTIMQLDQDRAPKE